MKLHLSLSKHMSRLAAGVAALALFGGLAAAANGANASTVPKPIPLTSSACPTDIQYGQKGGCVVELQLLLNKHGAKLSVDGDFGPATRTAVENYQRAHGLGVDGIVGPKTKASLDGGSTPPPPPSGNLARIVAFAHDVENGDKLPGWGGGKVPYGWDGGHGAKPGPSPAHCNAAPADQACWDATRSGGLGHNGQISVDCSGFVRWVFSMAYGRDVLGPYGTGTQIREMHRVSTPRPGDVVFFGSAGNPHHVGIYIGNGLMIDSPSTGHYVRTDSVHADLIGYYEL